MSQHIPPALMDKFVEGDLEEPVAVAVALHIDQCSRCHSAASAADSLSQEFATVDDPEVPPDLLDAIHEYAKLPQEVQEPASRPRSNTALFVLAAGLLVAFFLYPESMGPASEAQLGDTYTATDGKATTQLVVGITIGLVVGAWLSFRSLSRRRQEPKKPQ